MVEVQPSSSNCAFAKKTAIVVQRETGAKDANVKRMEDWIAAKVAAVASLHKSFARCKLASHNVYLELRNGNFMQFCLSHIGIRGELPVAVSCSCAPCCESFKALNLCSALLRSNQSAVS